VFSVAERQRYDTSPNASRADGFAAGRLLLHELVRELTGSTPVISAVCPDCGGCHGKPTIEGSELHVSLSRIPGLAVAAANWSSAVGIDVELLDQPQGRLDAIESWTGSRDVRAWTRIEAVLKADGRGLRVAPSDVRVDGDRAILDGVTYDLEEVAVAPDVVVSVATVAAV